ncbi:hypothetical protein V2J09_002648 [Rumex salicifolius]
MAMHRSSSTTRVSDEYFKVSSSSPTQGSPAGNQRLPVDGSVSSDSQLPVYSPSSYVAKRERSRTRFAENAVHLIPLILVVCAVILWFFSHPVDLIRRSSSFVSGMDQIKAASAIDVDGTQNSLLPH